MRRLQAVLISTGIMILAPCAALAAGGERTYLLKSASGLLLRNVAAEAAVYDGRPAVRLTETPAPDAAQARGSDGHSVAILPGSDFEDGVIEVELAGLPEAGAGDGARGFVGLAFRVSPDASRFECIYLRPTNGRADDQLRRNHSTQYISHPGFPWHRLRKEQPGVYESYADLVPGAWTRVKIEVSGVKARLYVNGATQPALIVNDLKLGPVAGGVALWIGPGTEAYFSKVVVRPDKRERSSGE
ncbi:MAG: hypothetical protein ACSLFQ_10405 [Thermoanaerobaculia bacterium]